MKILECLILFYYKGVISLVLMLLAPIILLEKVLSKFNIKIAIYNKNGEI